MPYRKKSRKKITCTHLVSLQADSNQLPVMNSSHAVRGKVDEKIKKSIPLDSMKFVHLSLLVSFPFLLTCSFDVDNYREVICT
jgi:hypothetical protein